MQEVAPLVPMMQLKSKIMPCSFALRMRKVSERQKTWNDGHDIYFKALFTFRDANGFNVEMYHDSAMG